ncbi:uncharacterized protein LOC119448028 [Dermacentor silvarum]|uniref:uncharacterized protein LOC119448028 n=1 Tax=Dermacentor silvarum TaxID=543639 RepID=UPI002101132C|nr:uncharacterized protein LOC119448028 [Dermacentor silvarum]
MKPTNAAVFCAMSLCAIAVAVRQAHPAIVMGGGSYGCNCPMLNVLAARQCCVTVGTCCLAAGMGIGGYGGHLGGVEYGYPIVSYAPIALRVHRTVLAHAPWAHGGLQLNIGAGLGR